MLNRYAASTYLCIVNTDSCLILLVKSITPIQVFIPKNTNICEYSLVMQSIQNHSKNEVFWFTAQTLKLVFGLGSG